MDGVRLSVTINGVVSPIHAVSAYQCGNWHVFTIVLPVVSGNWRWYVRSDQTPRASSGNYKQTKSGWIEEKTWDVGRSPQTYCRSNADTLGGSKEVWQKEALRLSIQNRATKRFAPAG